MKIATFNVNSIRVRLDQIIPWIAKAEIDILLVQEIKCETDIFPYQAFKDAGYHALAVGQKSYNGVAILSREALVLREATLPGDQNDPQARYIEAENNKGLIISSLYLPNGNPINSEKFPYKLAWMDRLFIHIRDRLLPLERPFILGGDFNVCPTYHDCYDEKMMTQDALCQAESRQKFNRLLHLGLSDAYRSLHSDPGYSYWDYQKGRWDRDEGLRIDFFLTSPQATDILESCVVERELRNFPKASDHTSVVMSLREG